MKKLIGATTLALFLFLVGFCEGTVEVIHDDGTYEVGPSGCVLGTAYLQSKQCVLLARDLTEQEMDEADDLPGGGYNDGKWSGENPPDDNEYAAQHVFEDDDGNIFILEDDGEITEIST